MKINEFRIERYFAEYEFKTRYLLSSSDCESLTVNELLQMADPQCLDLWNNLRLGYTETRGHPLLRKEIAKLYTKISPDNICVLSPEEGIFIALNVMLEAGDHVIVTDPGYQSLSEIPASLGCEVTRWPVYLTDREWHLDLSFLKHAIRKDTRLIIINFPHNPTGFIPDETDLRKIIDLAVDNGIYLFSDEMYRYLEFSEFITSGSIADIYEKGITLSGLSKSFGLPGLRIGWIASRDYQLIGRIERFKDYTTICNSALSEIMSIIALRNKEQILNRNINLIRENMNVARELFRRHDELLTWIEPMGSSVAFPRLNERIPVDEFCKTLLDHKSVLLMPANMFGSKGNHFRIGFGKKSFRESFKQFVSFLIENYIN
jgi:aspartate/methionine/tyrosine aminotransferase